MDIIVKDKLAGPRITLSSDGEIRLKYPTGTDEGLVKRLTALTLLCESQLGIPEFTLRGRVNDHKGVLSIRLQNESKSISETVILEES